MAPVRPADGGIASLFIHQLDECRDALSTADCAADMRVISTQVIDAWYAQWQNSPDKKAALADINEQARSIPGGRWAQWVDIHRDGWHAHGTPTFVVPKGALFSTASLHRGPSPAEGRPVDLVKLDAMFDSANKRMLHAVTVDAPLLVNSRHDADALVDALGAMDPARRGAAVAVLTDDVRRDIAATLMSPGARTGLFGVQDSPLDTLDKAIGKHERLVLFYELGGGNRDDDKAPRLMPEPVRLGQLTIVGQVTPTPAKLSAVAKAPLSLTVETARAFLNQRTSGDAHVRALAASLITMSEAVMLKRYPDPSYGHNVAIGYSLTFHEATRQADLLAAGVPAKDVDAVIAGRCAMTIEQVKALTVTQIEQSYEPQAKAAVGDELWGRLSAERKAVLIDIQWQTRKGVQGFPNAIAALKRDATESGLERAWHRLVSYLPGAAARTEFVDEIDVKIKRDGQLVVDERRLGLRLRMLEGEAAWRQYIGADRREVAEAR